MSEPAVDRDAAKFIPVAKPSIGPAEKEAVAKVMESGWISSGPVVEAFENEFATAHGKKFGVCCNSGTTALQLALMASHVSPGCDAEGECYIACPAMTMVAVPNAIISAGGRPEFIDSDPGSGNICQAGIDELPMHVWAAIYPYLYGVPIEIDDFREEWAIEDCAEATYASFADGTPVGSRGDFACFSFFANKIVACGEGGMVLTNDPSAATRLRGLRAHAFTAGEHFHHREHALGARMTDLQAAIGLVQHHRRWELLARRYNVAMAYTRELRQIPWVDFQGRTPGSVWWVFPILIRDGFGITRDSVRHRLAEAGIETRSWFKPLSEQPHLRKFASGSYPVAADLYRRGLYLPLFADLTDEDLNYIIEHLASVQSQRGVL